MGPSTGLPHTCLSFPPTQETSKFSLYWDGEGGTLDPPVSGRDPQTPLYLGRTPRLSRNRDAPKDLLDRPTSLGNAPRPHSPMLRDRDQGGVG